MVDLNNNNWILVAPHLPIELRTDQSNSVIVASETEFIKDIIHLQNNINLERRENQSIFTSGTAIQASDSTLVAVLDSGIEQGFVEWVKSLKRSTCQIQWNCIKLTAKYLLGCFLGHNPAPIRVMLHGEGGTGKSYIIDVITKMAELLHHPEWLVKCAYTGKAAINIQGDTIDGVFGFQRQGILLELTYRKRSIELVLPGRTRTRKTNNH
ncbi:hypothetical protein BC833DRAFT_613704 [Globomyces pollinis-pini]|nr:hypothetical protein BC833DRAFT_613704 [Globomyces pollinis-pini]